MGSFKNMSTNTPNNKFWKIDRTGVILQAALRLIHFTLGMTFNFFVGMFNLFFNRSAVKTSNIFVDLTGKLVVVTGGAGGIGLEAVKKFARMGANVIVVDRNITLGEELVNSLKTSYSKAEFEFIHAEYSSFASVRKAAEMIKRKHTHIDILCNNAGTQLPHSITEDGYDVTFQVNYLSTFLFTQILMPCLDGRSRVVYTASSFHRYGSKTAALLLNAALYGTPYAHAYTDGKQAFVLNCIHMRNVLSAKNPKNAQVKRENVCRWSTNLGEDQRDFSNDPLFVAVDPGAVNSGIWWAHSNKYNPFLFFGQFFASRFMLSCVQASEVVVGAAVSENTSKHIFWAVNKEHVSSKSTVFDILNKTFGLGATHGSYCGFWPANFFVADENVDSEAAKLWKMSEVLVEGRWQGEETAKRVAQILA
eukprot:GDKK01075596.1.p1 GENE.GDKK01075596.1~~GDKK01075596.1.p1  ORF type:complete len:420 (-),score=76.02 GDKK01075596.1:234-1493(-)